MVTLTVTEPTTANLVLAVPNVVTLEVDAAYGGGGSTPVYTGSYAWTPSTSSQTIPISGLKASSDITIDAIPSNYGLITWDGSKITVS